MAADAPSGLTVGIATRNRPDALRRCLASIALIDDLVTEVIIVDDASDRPIDPVLKQIPEAIATGMSGSGATCFALFGDRRSATLARRIVAAERPDWWVEATAIH